MSLEADYREQAGHAKASLEYCKRLCNGAAHSAALCHHAYEELSARVLELVERVEQLEREKAEAFAAIGELRERLDKAAEVVKGLKKNG